MSVCPCMVLIWRLKNGLMDLPVFILSTWVVWSDFNGQNRGPYKRGRLYIQSLLINVYKTCFIGSHTHRGMMGILSLQITPKRQIDDVTYKN